MTTKTFAVQLKHIALFLLLLLPISALGSRFQLWPYTVGLLIFAAALVGSLLIEVICTFWLINKPKADVRRVLRLASLLALPPLILTAALMRGYTSGTMLHDISTDLSSPPQFIAAQGLRAETSNTLEHTSNKSQAQNKLYPHIKSINNALSQHENYTAALNIAEEMDWSIHFKKPEQGHFEAVETTLWFGFKDDIVIRARNNQLDIRSISRVGKSDLGANAGRIEEFIKNFSSATSH